MPINPWVIVVGLVLLAGAAAGGFKFGSDYQLGQAARDEVLIEKAGKAAGEQAAKAIADIDVKLPPIRGIIEKAIKDNAVYTECKPTQDAVDAVNEARRAP